MDKKKPHTAKLVGQILKAAIPLQTHSLILSLLWLSPLTQSFCIVVLTVSLNSTSSVESFASPEALLPC